MLILEERQNPLKDARMIMPCCTVDGRHEFYHLERPSFSDSNEIVIELWVKFLRGGRKDKYVTYERRRTSDERGQARLGQNAA